MNTRVKFAFIQLVSIPVILAFFIASNILIPQYPWLGLIPMFLTAFISLKLSRKCLCPKCRKPIGEGPYVEFAGIKINYHTPWPAKKCRFCGAEINQKTNQQTYGMG